MDVDEFLLARLAEDEAVARGAVYAEPEWRVETAGDWVRVTSGGEFTEDAEGDYYFGAHPVARSLDVPISRQQLVHVARHDPERVLREIESKRKIIENWRMYADAQFPDFEGGYSSACDAAVRHLAEAYADHPEFATIIWDQ